MNDRKTRICRRCGEPEELMGTLPNQVGYVGRLNPGPQEVWRHVHGPAWKSGDNVHDLLVKDQKYCDQVVAFQRRVVPVYPPWSEVIGPHSFVQGELP